MPPIRFAEPLRPGALIAVTAPSSGVSTPLHARLGLVLDHLRSRGLRVVEGRCLRAEHKNASAPAAERAAELQRFLEDPQVAAILPPWGGELAIELLPRLDFEALRALPPKWVLGFSDISTLMLPLTLLAGWATAHGSNLMDLAPQQTEALVSGVLPLLAAEGEATIVQRATPLWQRHYIDFAVQTDAVFNLTEPTRWQRLDGADDPLELRGRLLGGCIDTISRLAGSRFGDVPGFVRASAADGCLLFLENCEMAPCELLRALWSLRLAGWFEGLSGLLIGRNSGPEARSEADLGVPDALRSALADLPFPVLFDLDIGHHQPQLTLVNGALTTLRFEPPGGTLTQQLRR